VVPDNTTLSKLPLSRVPQSEIDKLNHSNTTAKYLSLRNVVLTLTLVNFLKGHVQHPFLGTIHYQFLGYQYENLKI
jgi:hypothetical protein